MKRLALEILVVVLVGLAANAWTNGRARLDGYEAGAHSADASRLTAQKATDQANTKLLKANEALLSLRNQVSVLTRSKAVTRRCVRLAPAPVAAPLQLGPTSDP